MSPSGAKAFEQRDPARSGIDSFENRPKSLETVLERQFKRHKNAWAFFGAQPLGYRRIAILWVMSAKKDETRLRRLSQLIRDSANGLRLALLSGRAQHRT